MNDQLERLFADLRADELPRVVPPGADAARRKVRRRRVVTSSVTAGVAVLAVAGGLVVGLAPRSGDRNSAGTAHPRYDLPELTRKIADRLQMNVDDEDDTSGITEKVGSATGTSVAKDLIGGNYEAKVVCAGAGTVDVTVNVTAVGYTPTSTVSTVTCDMTAAVLSIPFTVPGPGGKLSMEADLGSAEKDQAVFGYRFGLTEEAKDVMIADAKDAIGAADQEISSMSGFLATGDGFQDETMHAGDYRLRVACEGTGAIDIAVSDELDAVRPLKSFRMDCTRPAQAHTFDFTMPKGTKMTIVTLDPTAESRNQGAAAMRVEHR